MITTHPTNALPSHDGPARPSHPATVTAVAVQRVGLMAAAAATCWAAVRAQTPDAAVRDTQVWMNLAIIGVDLICLGTLAPVLRSEGSSLRRLLTTRTPVRDALLGLGLIVPLTLGFFAATFLGNLVVFGGAPPASGALPHVPLVLGLVSLLVMPVTVAVTEEVLYRAYVLPRLEARWGRAAAVGVMALCFGAQHVFLSLGDPQTMLARFMTTFLAGLVFAGLWFLIKRRIWPLILAHWLLDVLFLGLPMLGLAWGA